MKATLLILCRLRGVHDVRRGEATLAAIPEQGGLVRVPAELHAAGPVGYRLRDGRRTDTADDTAEQVALSGAPRRTSRGIVSSHCYCYYYYDFTI